MIGTKSDDTAVKYKKQNMTQILKIRHIIRKNEYLMKHSEEVEHTDIEKFLSLDSDLLYLKDIAAENVKNYF